MTAFGVLDHNILAPELNEYAESSFELVTKLRHHILSLASKGRYFVTKYEILNRLRIPESEFGHVVTRLKQARSNPRLNGTNSVTGYAIQFSHLEPVSLTRFQQNRILAGQIYQDLPFNHMRQASIPELGCEIVELTLDGEYYAYRFGAVDSIVVLISTSQGDFPIFTTVKRLEAALNPDQQKIENLRKFKFEIQQYNPPGIYTEA